MRLHEIETGGAVDSSFLKDLEAKHDFKHPQQDLFHDIPTLDPKLPKSMEIVGAIGSYRVVKATQRQGFYKHDYGQYFNFYDNENGDAFEYDYVLFDKNKPICWVGLCVPPKIGFRINDMSDIGGTAGQVVSIYLNQAYRGGGVALAFYKWILTHVCDYLVADETHTWGGVALWQKALNSKMFDVEVFDKRTGKSRKRWAGKDFDYVYKTNDLIPWMTLRGKANRLLFGDDGGEDAFV